MEPGSTHDLTAAREHCLGALYPAAAQGLPSLADKGYQGRGIGVHTPIKGRNLGVDNRAYHALLTGMRAIGERANALLDQRWKALGHVTLSPDRGSARSSLPRWCSPPWSVEPGEKTSLEVKKALAQTRDPLVA